MKNIKNFRTLYITNNRQQKYEFMPLSRKINSKQFETNGLFANTYLLNVFRGISIYICQCEKGPAFCDCFWKYPTGLLRKRESVDSFAKQYVCLYLIKSYGTFFWIDKIRQYVIIYLKWVSFKWYNPKNGYYRNLENFCFYLDSRKIPKVIDSIGREYEMTRCWLF